MYKYEDHRAYSFTDEGQRDLLRVRDHIANILRLAGCIRNDCCYPAGLATSDSWTQMALVDRLVEIGDLRRIDYSPCAGQHQVYMAPAGLALNWR